MSNFISPPLNSPSLPALDDETKRTVTRQIRLEERLGIALFLTSFAALLGWSARSFPRHFEWASVVMGMIVLLVAATFVSEALKRLARAVALPLVRSFRYQQCVKRIEQGIADAGLVPSLVMTWETPIPGGIAADLRNGLLLLETGDTGYLQVTLHRTR